MLLACRKKEYKQMFILLHHFKFLEGYKSINLPFIDNTRERKVRITQRKQKFYIKYDKPNSYIILKQLQYLNSMQRVLEYVDVGTRHYVQECLRKNKKLLYDEF
jgi:hypothetical protein